MTILQVMVLLGVSASVGVALGLFINLSNVLPSVGDFEAPEATIIYSSDNVILGRIYREDRTNVPLNDIPKNLANATVAIEDKRFYHHSGIDMKGIARAIWQNVRGQRMAQGGSTITQQLARNVYLTQRKSMSRKVQEAVLAILMERNFTKQKILELYMNQVYYGSGAFGVQAASRVYFGKDVDKLDLSQCAMLAGMPQKPSGYSPHEDLEAATGRRNVVLIAMADLGYITPQQRDEATAEKLDIVRRAKGRNTYKAPHFVDYVTRQLKEKYGDDVLFQGGLRVYTTLNYKMQQIAEKALRDGVKKHEKLRHVSEGCFVAIEPATGYVRAMVGSVDPASQFNRCTQASRQPGSSFKAFVYTAALAAGMKPTDRILDAPVSYPGGSDKRWNPKNYDNRWHGWVTMESAVARSINIPAIKVAEKVGMTNVIKYAQLMGVKSVIEPYLSSAIGASALRPIEIASAYGTFANAGVYVEPCSIVRVTNSRGEIYQDYVPEGRRVISERVNSDMDKMLRAVVTRSGGTGRSVISIPEARGKTGTTSDDRDAWFLGYVPEKLVAACWVGNDNYSSMRRAFGGLVCAPIWKEFMLKSLPIYENIHKDDKQVAKKVKVEKAPNVVHRDEQSPSEPQPQERPVEPTPDVTASDSDVVSVRLCNESQLLATRYCPATHSEKMLRGTEPTTYCTIHSQSRRSEESASQNAPRRSPAPDVQYVTVVICRESGLLATRNCPSERKRVPIDEVPTQVCTAHSRARE
ncbi:MAG: transglycosylase domain-containing protein [Armatimonadota bacterium]